jgi:hypothetical protein
LGSISALPAAAAIDPYGADLTIDMGVSPNPVTSGQVLTYTLTIRNTRLVVREFDPETHTTITTTYGADVSGVTVQDSLPDGFPVVSVSGDSGFTCTQASWRLTCAGGSIRSNGVAHITIGLGTPYVAPGTSLTVWNTAVVNPASTIDERSYANNSVTAKSEVWPCCLN